MLNSINKILKYHKWILVSIQFHIALYFILFSLFSSSEDPQTISSKFLNQIPSSEVILFEENQNTSNPNLLNEKQFGNSNFIQLFAHSLKAVCQTNYYHYPVTDSNLYYSAQYFNIIIPRSPPV